MIRRPPKSKRKETIIPYTTLVRSATARTRTGTDEVDRAAGAAQIRAAALLGVDLAGEIDFECGIDRHQLVELREYRGVVRVCGRAHAHGLVAVRPLVELARADQRAVDRHAGVDLLARVGDDAGFDQIGRATG